MSQPDDEQPRDLQRHDGLDVEAASIETSFAAIPADEPNPFGLEPAPEVVIEKTPPIDLGKYSNGRFANWMVIFNKDVELRVYELLAAASAEGEEDQANNKVIEQIRTFIMEICIGWNFRLMAQQLIPGHPTPLMPQPYDNGGKFLSTSLIRAISAAYVDATRDPAKKSKGR